jgi:hypothetical protein
MITMSDIDSSFIIPPQLRQQSSTFGKLQRHKVPSAMASKPSWFVSLPASMFIDPNLA